MSKNDKRMSTLSPNNVDILDYIKRKIIRNIKWNPVLIISNFGEVSSKHDGKEFMPKKMLIILIWRIVKAE